MTIQFRKMACAISFALISVLLAAGVPGQGKMDGIERDRMRSMLKNIKGAIKKDYYDDKFHGVDIDARFKLADQRLDETASTGQALGIIAQVLMDFNDSHLFFLPPSTNLRVEYGWRMKMVGDKCLVTSVQPNSDADAKGIKPGDQLLSVEGFRPTRKEMWKMLYYYNVLSKRQGLKLNVVSPGGAPRELDVRAKLKQLPINLNADNFFTMASDFNESRNDKHIFQKVGGISIWRMPSFSFEPPQVDSLMAERIAGSSALILDLRGNGGGYVKTLERLAGFIFDRDLKIADLKGRKPMDPITSKTRGKGAFGGKVVVLIDSESGSASEILARLVQLEKRGVVLGDTSAGAVMQSRSFDGESGGGSSSVFYGASITNADVIMSDGKSVEHVGVIPDEKIVPSPEDVAAKRDPVLSRAVEVLGGNLPPEIAGKFFIYDWSGK
jgi:carboxyl-terminal processing protease